MVKINLLKWERTLKRNFGHGPTTGSMGPCGLARQRDLDEAGADPDGTLRSHWQLLALHNTWLGWGENNGHSKKYPDKKKQQRSKLHWIAQKITFQNKHKPEQSYRTPPPTIRGRGLEEVVAATSPERCFSLNSSVPYVARIQRILQCFFHLRATSWGMGRRCHLVSWLVSQRK